MMWYYDLVRPLMVVVGWIMTGTHWVFSRFLDPDSGLAWVLSIVGLVVIIRIAMIPLFVRQIRSQRGMQLMQPELQKIQKRYKGKTDPISRQRQQEEMMALYRKNGTSPFSSCLPILVQSPFFLALFGMLTSLTRVCERQEGFGPIGTITPEVACSVQGATLFGAPLSSTFTLADQAPDGVAPLTVRVVTAILIVAMSATTFTTQRQLTMKNIPEAARDNPMFRAQKMMLYVFPLIFAFSGINFPIGVLMYWLTTNLWTMGQQFIVIRRMPAAGSEAAKRLEERQAAKRARMAKKAGVTGEDGDSPEGGGAGGDGAGDSPGKGSGQRSQPKKQSRSQRKSRPGQGTSPAEGASEPAAAGTAGEEAPRGAAPGGATNDTSTSGSGSGAGDTDPDRATRKRKGKKR